jgi:hypothetical protein
MTTANSYQPGVCNIGPAEIRRRRNTGISGAVVSVALLVVFVVFNVPNPWRAIVLFPAGLSAAGFLQAAFHFCVAFGMTGLFNFGTLGTQDAVHEKEYRRKDQQKALLIAGLSGVVALATFAIAVLLP